MSVNAWANHFKRMSERKNLLDEMYVLNQKGRGFGNKNGHMIYRLNQKGSGNYEPTIISPVEQAVKQAKSQLEDEGINGNIKKRRKRRIIKKKGKKVVKKTKKKNMNKKKKKSDTFSRKR